MHFCSIRSQYFRQWTFVCANIKRSRATTNAQTKHTIWQQFGHAAKWYWFANWNDLRTKSRRWKQSRNALHCEWRRPRCMHKRYTIQRIGTICCDWHLWNDKTSENHSNLWEYVSLLSIPISSEIFFNWPLMRLFLFSFLQLRRYRAYAATQFCHLLNEIQYRIYHYRPKSKTIYATTKMHTGMEKHDENEERHTDRKSIDIVGFIKWGTDHRYKGWLGMIQKITQMNNSWRKLKQIWYT